MDESLSGRAGIDIIFCRNILIYFDKATQAKVLSQLCEPPGARRLPVPGPFGVDRRHRPAGRPDRQHRLPEASCHARRSKDPCPDHR
jgi:hypothetical protein